MKRLTKVIVMCGFSVLSGCSSNTDSKSAVDSGATDTDGPLQMADAAVDADSVGSAASYLGDWIFSGSMTTKCLSLEQTVDISFPLTFQTGTDSDLIGEGYMYNDCLVKLDVNNADEAVLSPEQAACTLNRTSDDGTPYTVTVELNDTTLTLAPDQASFEWEASADNLLQPETGAPVHCTQTFAGSGAKP